MDFVAGTRDALTRRAKLIPWTDDNLTGDVDFQQTEPNEEYFNVGSASFDSLGLFHEEVFVHWHRQDEQMKVLPLPMITR